MINSNNVEEKARALIRMLEPAVIVGESASLQEISTLLRRADEALGGNGLGLAISVHQISSTLKLEEDWPKQELRLENPFRSEVDRQLREIERLVAIVLQESPVHAEVVGTGQNTHDHHETSFCGIEYLRFGSAGDGDSEFAMAISKEPVDERGLHSIAIATEQGVRSRFFLVDMSWLVKFSNFTSAVVRS